MKVAMLLGCVQRAFFGDVNAATARVLAAYGCEVLAPRDQGCCGALELHAGRAPAERRRTALLDRLGALGVDRIVVNSAGCGSALKEADHPAAALVRDVHEVLAELGPPRRLGRLDLRVAYHDACHLGHAQGVRAEPRAVLAAIPGVELLEVPDAEICCGSAGVYNLLEPGPRERPRPPEGSGHRRARRRRDRGREPGLPDPDLGLPRAAHPDAPSRPAGRSGAPWLTG